MVDALKHAEQELAMSAIHLDLGIHCDAFEELPLFEDTDGTSSDVDSVLDAVGLLPPSDVWMDLDADTPIDGLAIMDQLPRPADEWTRRRTAAPRVAKASHGSMKPKAKKTPKVVVSHSGEDSPPPLRMRTYTARKNEIERLTAELPQLEAYVDYLKQQAVQQSGKKSSVDKQRLVNSKLRELAHRQQFSVARVLSAMTRFSTHQSQMLPLDRAIHLPKDASGRAKVLTSLRGRVLRDARAFMKERTCYLDADSLPCHEQSSHVTPEGDSCCTEFAAQRFEGVTSVKAVYDAFRTVLSKRDVLISEITGDCAVCEDLDASPEVVKRGITHQRLVCSAPGGLLVESNGVLFSEYRPRDEDVCDDDSADGQEQATFVLHAVEKDELHPYVTEQQLRLDVTCIITITSRKFSAGGNSKDSSSTNHMNSHSDEKIEVVVSRSTLNKLHRTDLAVSPAEMRMTRDRLMQQGPVLVESVAALQVQQG